MRRIVKEINRSYRTDADRRTTTGYRDDQKRKIFEEMDEVKEHLQLHESVVEHAKRIFARFRDKEKIMKVYEHVAACLIIAFRERVNADKVPTEKPLSFPCKYCGEDFSGKRDRVLHLMSCDKKTATTNADTQPSSDAVAGVAAPSSSADSIIDRSPKRLRIS